MRGNSTVQVVQHYKRMIMMMYTFICAIHHVQFELHLSSLDEMCIYSFTHDKQKYARLVPRYLAALDEGPAEDRSRDLPRVHGWELHCTVHKNEIPFCAVGVDHALEHINWIIKVTVGIVGIT